MFNFDGADIATIISAILGLVGAVAATLFGKRHLEKKEEVIAALQAPATTIDHSTLSDFLQEWEELEASVNHLIINSAIDAVVISKAFTMPGGTNLVWGASVHSTPPYDSKLSLKVERVELDQRYKDIIESVCVKGHYVIVTKDEPESLLKTRYEAADITFSAWFHVIDEDVLHDVSVTTTIGFLSRDKFYNPFDKFLVARCQSIASRVKVAALTFNPKGRIRHGY